MQPIFVSFECDDLFKIWDVIDIVVDRIDVVLVVKVDVVVVNAVAADKIDVDVAVVVVVVKVDIDVKADCRFFSLLR